MSSAEEIEAFAQILTQHGKTLCFESLQSPAKLNLSAALLEVDKIETDSTHNTKAPNVVNGDEDRRHQIAAATQSDLGSECDSSGQRQVSHPESQTDGGQASQFCSNARAPNRSQQCFVMFGDGNSKSVSKSSSKRQRNSQHQKTYQQRTLNLLQNVQKEQLQLLNQVEQLLAEPTCQFLTKKHLQDVISECENIIRCSHVGDQKRCGLCDIKNGKKNDDENKTRQRRRETLKRIVDGLQDVQRRAAGMLEKNSLSSKQIAKELSFCRDILKIIENH